MYKLVIADDEPAALRFIRHVITEYKLPIFICGEAENGEQAAELACKHKPDFIIMDIAMPLLDGIKATEIIKKQHPDIKIYFLTAYDHFEYAKKAVKLDVEDYLLKPVTPQQLIFALKSGIASVLRKRLAKYKSDKFYHQVEVAKLTFRRQLFYILNSGQELPAKELRIAQRIFGLNLLKANSVLSISIWNQSRCNKEEDNFLETMLRDLDLKFGFGLYAERINSSGALFCLEKPEKLLREASEAITAWCKQSDVNFSAGVAPITQAGNFKEAYIQAEQACKSALFWREEGVFLPGTFTSIPPYIPNAAEIQQNILKAVYLRQPEKALSILRETLSIMKNGRYSSYQAVLFITDIFVALFNAVSGCPIPVKKVLELRSNFDADVALIKNVIELDQVLTRMIKDITESSFLKMESAAEKAIKLSVLYINENYHSKITLKQMAGKLYLNPCYFSRIFKKYVGEGFIAYLNRVRLEKADALLASGKYSVAEVSKMVGFQDPGYFSVVYKKCLQATPVQTIQNKTGQKS
ncbi:MAG: response regulator [Syntrophomonadaceae bacterium]|nr:response regulator [Syntrophomonadaceae bacterium]